MKKIFRNNRIIAIAFITVFSALTTAAMAGNGENPSSPVQLKYAGKLNEQPVFQLNVNGSAENNQFQIVIRDNFGTALYTENIKAEKFTKNFLLNTDEIGDDTIRFEITSWKTKETITYSVNRNTRFVEETAEYVKR